MITLRDLLLDSRDGEWGKGEPFDQSVHMQAIRGTDFEDVRLGNISSVPDRHLDARHAARKKLQKWDIVFETAGGSKDRPTGRSVLLTPSRMARFELPVTCASFARFLRIDPEKADPEFVFWLLQDMYTRRELLRFHTQHTGVARFQFTTFADTWPLNLPPRPVQRRIADILSAYDDLIENNTRRIAILEDMARSLFEEWFVAGNVPAGQPALATTAMPISEAFAIVGGGTPSKAETIYWDDGTVDWYTPTDLTRAKSAFLDRSKDRITEIGLAKSGAQRFPARSIMMTSRATLGVFAINTGPATTNQGFITCIPNADAPLYWLFHWLKSNAERFEGIASGSTFKEITKGNFKKLEIELPSRASVQAYESLVAPKMEMVLSLLRANTNLRTTRDLLLPKLISGEIEVRTAEEELEAAAA